VINPATEVVDAKAQAVTALRAELQAQGQRSFWDRLLNRKPKS
jgi:hypothetical protein